MREKSKDALKPGEKTTKSLPFEDKSMGVKGYPSVNSEPTRDKPAPTPKTLGPREA